MSLTPSAPTRTTLAIPGDGLLGAPVVGATTVAGPGSTFDRLLSLLDATARPTAINPDGSLPGSPGSVLVPDEPVRLPGSVPSDVLSPVLSTLALYADEQPEHSTLASSGSSDLQPSPGEPQPTAPGLTLAPTGSVRFVKAFQSGSHSLPLSAPETDGSRLPEPPRVEVIKAAVVTDLATSDVMKGIDGISGSIPRDPATPAAPADQKRVLSTLALDASPGSQSPLRLNRDADQARSPAQPVAPAAARPSPTSPPAQIASAPSVRTAVATSQTVTLAEPTAPANPSSEAGPANRDGKDKVSGVRADPDPVAPPALPLAGYAAAVAGAITTPSQPNPLAHPEEPGQIVDSPSPGGARASRSPGVTLQAEAPGRTGPGPADASTPRSDALSVISPSTGASSPTTASISTQAPPAAADPAPVSALPAAPSAATGSFPPPIPAALQAVNAGPKPGSPSGQSSPTGRSSTVSPAVSGKGGGPAVRSQPASLGGVTPDRTPAAAGKEVPLDPGHPARSESGDRNGDLAASGPTSSAPPAGSPPPPAVVAAADQNLPVEPRQTVAGLSAQIFQNAGAKASRFDVQLTPEGLGRVDVALQIDAAGKVSATLNFDRPEAAALVRSHSAELRDALAGLGLVLGPDAIAIGHVRGGDASGSADQPQTVASQSPVSGGASDSPQPGANGQLQTPSFGTGGAATGQGGGQPQGDRPTPQFGGAHSFAMAADAAEVVDQRQAYSARLSTRGLDIRI